MREELSKIEIMIRLRVMMSAYSWRGLQANKSPRSKDKNNWTRKNDGFKI